MVLRDKGLSDGTTPLPMKVLATGIFVLLANLKSSSDALPRITPFPAMITGFFARLIISAAISTDRSSGAGMAGFMDPAIGLYSISSDAIFSGISMWHAPGFSDSAILNAFLTISGMVEESSTRVFHFVSGLKHWTMSTN